MSILKMLEFNIKEHREILKRNNKKKRKKKFSFLYF